MGTDGYIVYNDATTNSLVVLNAFTWQGGGLYIYPGVNGVFYRIAGSVGARSLVVSWYAGTFEQGAEQNHFTVTFFENAQVAQLKYYDVVQAQPQAFAYIQIGSFYLLLVPSLSLLLLALTHRKYLRKRIGKDANRQFPLIELNRRRRHRHPHSRQPLQPLHPILPPHLPR